MTKCVGCEWPSGCKAQFNPPKIMIRNRYRYLCKAHVQIAERDPISTAETFWALDNWKPKDMVCPLCDGPLMTTGVCVSCDELLVRREIAGLFDKLVTEEVPDEDDESSEAA